MKIAFLILAVFMSAPIYAAPDTHMLTSLFLHEAQDATALLPFLDKDVDKCFNPLYSSYVQQSHQILKMTLLNYAQFVQEISTASANYSRDGQAQKYDNVVSDIQTRLLNADVPIKQNAEELTKDGFTTSDKTTGLIGEGQAKYPGCNSKNNDDPAGKWAKFYGDMQSMESDIANLRSAVAGLKK